MSLGRRQVLLSLLLPACFALGRPRAWCLCHVKNYVKKRTQRETVAFARLPADTVETRLLLLPLMKDLTKHLICCTAEFRQIAALSIDALLEVRVSKPLQLSIAVESDRLRPPPR
eukprot:5456432-Amphidinium_carterae.1